MTVHQRTQYVNTYACPVLEYLSFVSQPKKTHLKQIVSAIYQYIWNEKFPPKLKTDNMFIYRNHGGLQVIHVECKMKELFIRTMLEQVMRKKESPTSAWYETWKRKEKKYPPKYNQAFEEIYEIEKLGMSLEISGKIDKVKLKEYYEKKKQLPPLKIIENGSYSEEEVDKSFILLESCLLPPKVKEHMFFFMHNLLPTEESKVKMNMSGSNGNCKLCEKKLETQYHVMLECEKQETNVAGLRNLLASVTGKKDVINLEKAVYLKVDDEAYTRTIVYIVLLFCYYTWKRKEKQKEDYDVINRVETEWKRIRIMKCKKIENVFGIK